MVEVEEEIDLDDKPALVKDSDDSLEEGEEDKSEGQCSQSEGEDGEVSDGEDKTQNNRNTLAKHSNFHHNEVNARGKIKPRLCPEFSMTGKCTNFPKCSLLHPGLNCPNFFVPLPFMANQKGPMPPMMMQPQPHQFQQNQLPQPLIPMNQQNPGNDTKQLPPPISSAVNSSNTSPVKKDLPPSLTDNRTIRPDISTTNRTVPMRGENSWESGVMKFKERKKLRKASKAKGEHLKELTMEDILNKKHMKTQKKRTRRDSHDSNDENLPIAAESLDKNEQLLKQLQYYSKEMSTAVNRHVNRFSSNIKTARREGVVPKHDLKKAGQRVRRNLPSSSSSSSGSSSGSESDSGSSTSGSSSSGSSSDSSSGSSSSSSSRSPSPNVRRHQQRRAPLPPTQSFAVRGKPPIDARYRGGAEPEMMRMGDRAPSARKIHGLPVDRPPASYFERNTAYGNERERERERHPVHPSAGVGVGGGYGRPKYRDEERPPPAHYSSAPVKYDKGASRPAPSSSVAVGRTRMDDIPRRPTPSVPPKVEKPVEKERVKSLAVLPSTSKGKETSKDIASSGSKKRKTGDAAGAAVDIPEDLDRTALIKMLSKVESQIAAKKTKKS